MARRRFGVDLTAVAWSTQTVDTVDDVLILARSATGITVWDAASGDGQITDLQDEAGNPITEVTADSNGRFTFFGPNTSPETVSVWLDAGFGGRQKAEATDLAEVVVSNRDRIDAIDTDLGNVDRVAELLTADPFYIAHRGSGDDHPEHTMDAYAGAVAAGARAIEISVVLSGDGVAVCGHDLTVDRVTAGTGLYSDHHYSGLRAIPVDMSEWIGPQWATVPHTPLREVLDRFLGQVVLFIEPKDTAAHNQMMDLLDSYPGKRGQNSVVYKSYKWGTLQDDAKARGYRVWSYMDFDTSTSEAQDIIDSGADYLGLPFRDDFSSFPTATDTHIGDIAALGVPLICWEVHRRWTVAHLSSLGVQGMMSSGWRHVTRTDPALSADTFSLGTRPPGDLPRTHVPSWQPAWDGDELVLDQDDPQTYMLGSLGWETPPTDYTLQFDIAFDSIPGDGNAHSGIAFGREDDSAYLFSSTLNTVGGYHVVLRADGRLQLYRHDAATASGTQLASATDAAPTAGAWRTYEVVVSATDITLQRTDGTPSTLISTTDTTYRGGYMHLTKNWSGGTADPVRYRNVAVSTP